MPVTSARALVGRSAYQDAVPTTTTATSTLKVQPNAVRMARDAMIHALPPPTNAPSRQLQHVVLERARPRAVSNVPSPSAVDAAPLDLLVYRVIAVRPHWTQPRSIPFHPRPQIVPVDASVAPPMPEEDAAISARLARPCRRVCTAWPAVEGHSRLGRVGIWA